MPGETPHTTNKWKVRGRLQAKGICTSEEMVEGSCGLFG